MARQNPGSSPYPEHDHLHTIQSMSQAAYDFIGWLSEAKSIELAKWEGERLWMIQTPLKTLLAEFHEVDLERLEEEKDRMLEQQRELDDDRRP